MDFSLGADTMTNSPCPCRRRFVIVWLPLALLFGMVTCSFAAPPSAEPVPDLLILHGPSPATVILFVLSSLAAVVILTTTIADVAIVWRRGRRPRAPRIGMP